LSRRHLHTRYVQTNCHAQCPKCNLWGSWEQYKHWVYIDKRYGKYTASLLEQLSLSTEKIVEDDFIATIQCYYDLCFRLWIDYKPKKQYYEQV
jgi:hypothetical protein